MVLSTVEQSVWQEERERHQHLQCHSCLFMSNTDEEREKKKRERDSTVSTVCVQSRETLAVCCWALLTLVSKISS